MAYSSLRRKAPLKAKRGFQPQYGFKKRGADNSSEGASRPQHGERKAPKKARKQTRSSLETHLDIVFSIFIRLRDAMPNGMVQCISCGRVLPFGRMQCGHFFSRKNMATRWDEDNCHAECALDNCFNPDHLVGYRANLIARIGQERFDELNVRAHGSRKWSGDELRGMIRHYTEEVRRLSKEKGISVRI